ncbi:MAG: histidine kinase dimerization/phospho-acceptor domain-containing protein, partial [Myxococcota bacterium]
MGRDDTNRSPILLAIVLVSASLVTLVMGVAWRATTDEVYDPWGIRVALAAWCLVLAGVLYRRMVGRAWIDRFLHVTTAAAMAWVGLLLWGNGFPSTHSAGIFVIEVACIASFRTVGSAALYVVAFAAMVGAVGQFTPNPEVSPLMLSITSLALGALVVASSAQRVGLTRALRRSRDRLEGEVRARTADLEAEIEVRRGAERRALAASETKSRFVANMSHELRTPLNAILGYAELALEEVDDLPGRHDITHELEAIGQAGRRLLSLVNDILDLARVEEGALELRVEPVDIGRAIGRVLQEGLPLARAHDNALSAEIADDLPTLVTDPVRFEQILMNLVSNAAKFTHRGRIVLRANHRHDCLFFEVQDTGIGIPADVLPTLF